MNLQANLRTAILFVLLFVGGMLVIGKFQCELGADCSPRADAERSGKLRNYLDATNGSRLHPPAIAN
jgi:hypothetical protein